MSVSFSGTEAEVIAQMRRFISAYRALDSKKKNGDATTSPEPKEEPEDDDTFFPHPAGSVHMKPIPALSHPTRKQVDDLYSIGLTKGWSAQEISNYMRSRWPQANGEPAYLKIVEFNDLLKHVFATDLNKKTV